MKPSRLIWIFKNLLVLRRIRGHSMQPTLMSGEKVIFSSLKRPKKGDIVMMKVGNIDYVKRLNFSAGVYSLIGDNSSDSKDIVGIDKRFCLGIIYHASTNRPSAK